MIPVLDSNHNQTWLAHFPPLLCASHFFWNFVPYLIFFLFILIMNNIELEQLLNLKLNSEKITDYAPNGLQVEGKANVHKIITGVTASQALINYAIEQDADAIIVHHGYFWKSENPCIRGMKGKRIKSLLVNDINLYSYHYH